MGQTDGRSTRRTTSDWGEEVLAIASNIAQGSDQECSRCLVTVPSGNTGTIQIANTTATANDVTLVEDIIYEFNVSNTNLLNFYGATNADKINIIWFK